ncbi:MULTISPECIES: response regulator [unclassified Microcoleus]|jgi:two-component system, NtrC family, sensor kinase|uniref:response regulator n=1 Tax=unclassified Microcoleus TaxID=2642155 RepID=UPI001D950695|nr:MULTISPECIES: response regulator [unclassified Microcoleus]MCC3418705.1 response regulator [Microcoleus sp. PH2017_07_MST_O_A]MCC3429347.1 response regulator [Microcoleus sp. PH2017_04_SCI_O_A]MCC3440577.1 response regulator [Microcoleus sp. PH2017_03_ELD_O_A]MCC3466674.1 response regulator [Microcoleus sp. PH2017_06_SFM_O_A]MCC3502622.1 response regulator [Microcoleus sp. PH2017_19_SFW_U_A]TAE54009.1 MAG: hybrid sensor histidine kinase/response regulator [Oscillatoriales cyanobacterium]
MNNDIPSTPPGNILVVDDTPANLRLLAGILNGKGYKVRPVPSGELALSAAQGMPPDLILLDIMMPEMNGYEVCEKIKADERTRDIPVIFISAINDVLDKVKAFAVGGVDYITKPFQMEEVLVRVETHLAMCQLQKKLKQKNDELTITLEQLQATQEQLVQSEKMAALGQLIAGIAHEINTPLGAIRSSIGNITGFLDNNLDSLPVFFKELSAERQHDFLSLMYSSRQQTYSLSTREKREFKRGVKQQLDAEGIDNADSLASILVNIGLQGNVQEFVPLLKDPDSENIIKTAYDFASIQKSARTIATATERAAKVVFALKNYARYDVHGDKLEVNITDGIETVLTLYQNQLKQGVEIVRNYQAQLPPVLCYPDELNQVWTNLIHNALQAMDNQGTLTIDAWEQDTNFAVKITDSGAGISPEILPKIFEPFFTTKPAGEGSGLGLDIVKKIIKKHQGTIDVESVPGQTAFTVSLPINLIE